MRLWRMPVSVYESSAAEALFPKNVELIRGLIFQKKPKPPLHSTLVHHLYAIINRQLPDGFLVFQYCPLKLADSEPEPDFSVIKGLERDFDTQHPTTAELVIEVSISTSV